MSESRSTLRFEPVAVAYQGEDWLGEILVRHGLLTMAQLGLGAVAAQVRRAQGDLGDIMARVLQQKTAPV